jgi:hypothetical protein
MTAAEHKRAEKPVAFAIATTLLAAVITASMLVWAQASPENVVIGLAGRHDGMNDERLAGCLDCHVPFVGTPGSRCLGPDCHGDLATGTPPKAGRAMPVRFHAVLREEPCTGCHVEHGTKQTVTATRTFTHELIPSEPRKVCVRCHSAGGIDAHARTDAVACDVCHGTRAWKGVRAEHERVATIACDGCHAAPSDKTHASFAGNCTECHDTRSWTPIAQPE